ncbi:MAG: hypothetical protein PHT54_00320 [Candidatus Nanoarchaeia archaeon]|nr:hypothetical protein [Candidatus Nanoarchaeia archaeon]
MEKRGLIIILIVLVSCPSLAILVQPPSLEISYEPNKEFSCTFSLSNNAEETKTFLIEPRGQLNNSITIEKEITIEPHAWEDISCRLFSSENLSPGINENSIVILESKGGQGLVGAIGGVEIKIYAYVPYPGKYIESVIKIEDSEINRQIPVQIVVKNIGKENIKNLEATISMISQNEEIAKLKIPSTALNVNEEKTLKTSWQTSKPGDYQASAIIYFDQNHKSTETTFKVWAEIIKIVDVSINKIEKDTTAIINVKIKNLWNSKIENAYLELFVKKDKEYVPVFRGPPVSINSWEEKTANIYFDSTDYEPSIYPAKILVNYNGKTIEKEIMLEVINPKLKITTFVLIFVIILLIAFFVINMVKHKNEKK